jgi:hypothetical protein
MNRYGDSRLNIIGGGGGFSGIHCKGSAHRQKGYIGPDFFIPGYDRMRVIINASVR